MRGEKDSGIICVNGAAAIQEDVDAIGLSSLAGAHDYLFPRVIELLKEKGADDIIVFGGGIERKMWGQATVIACPAKGRAV